MRIITPEVTHLIENLEGEPAGFDKKRKLFFPVQLKADAKGILTIYRGHVETAADRAAGRFKNGITAEQGEALYKEDVAKRVAELSTLVPATLKDHEYGACISLFFNNGSEPFHLSVGQALRSRAPQAIARNWMQYHKSGKPLKPRLGLWRRRATELLYFFAKQVLVASTPAKDDELFARLKALGFVFPRPHAGYIWPD